MARFKRLTEAEAETLTRSQILDRIEAEQQYWFRKHARGMSGEDEAAEKEFVRLLHKYAGPEVISAGLKDAKDYLEGRSTGGFWDQRPGDAPVSPGLVLDENQQAGLAYGLRLSAEMERSKCELCVYCGQETYVPGWGCTCCGDY